MHDTIYKLTCKLSGLLERQMLMSMVVEHFKEQG